jgi:nitrogen fixation NifU-like protein
MADVRELYQELILEHSKGPRNYRVMEAASHKAEGYNPLCGDHFTVFVDVEGDRIHDISFQGTGCAISKASASMMTQALKGKSTAEANDLFERFRQVVTGENDVRVNNLGKLAVFSGVSEFPIRVKCATLAWHALRAALQSQAQPVSTE